MRVQTTSPAEQIANELRAQIEAGEFRPGQALPSDATLAEQFEVSKPTVTKARMMLVALGMVEARPGAASRVRDVSRDPITPANRVARARRTGRIYPEGHYARILKAQLAPASATVAAALGLAAGAPAIERHRITHAPDDAPLAKSITYYAASIADRCPALLETQRIEQGTTLYIEQQTGRAASSIACTVWTQAGGSGPDSDAEQLVLPPGTGLLAVATTTYDRAGDPIAHEIELHPPDTPVALDIISV